MKVYNILCPEYVPLENKGEEAIIRGMADVIFPEGNVEFHIFDMNKTEYLYKDGLHIYPGKWFYSPWRSKEFGLGWQLEKLYSSFCSLLRHALNKITPIWLSVPHFPALILNSKIAKLKSNGRLHNTKDKLIKNLLACDYIVAGHDGAFDEYECHILDIMRQHGFKYGLFGTSLKPHVKNKQIIKLFQSTLKYADFLYCRDEIGHQWSKDVIQNDLSELAPDPAFGMKPESDERILSIIHKEGLEELFRKPVIMFTVCEPAPISRHSFSSAKTPMQKKNMHRTMMADLVRYIISEYDVNILFLPHSIGGIDEDDRIIARDILLRSGASTERARVLSTDYNARELKGLIARGELLVAERVHSMIGATGVHTPFLALGSKTDPRITAIVGKMLGLEDATYLLNEFELNDLLKKFNFVWKHRQQLAARLRAVDEEIQAKLVQCGVLIRNTIENA